MDSEKIAAQLALLSEQARWHTQMLHEVREDVKNLNKFMWRSIGMGMVAGGIASLIMTALIEYARARG